MLLHWQAGGRKPVTSSRVVYVRSGDGRGVSVSVGHRVILRETFRIESLKSVVTVATAVIRRLAQRGRIALRTPRRQGGVRRRPAVVAGRACRQARMSTAMCAADWSASRAVSLPSCLTADAEHGSELRPTGTKAAQPAYFGVHGCCCDFARCDKVLETHEVDVRLSPPSSRCSQGSGPSRSS